MTSQKNFRAESFVSDKAIKAPVQLVTTLDVPSLVGEQTIETVVLTIGDRVLLNAQTDPIDNGIWVVEQAAWNRAGDWDGGRDATNGTIVIVAGDPLISLYQLDVAGTFTIGASDATFILMSTLNLAGLLASTANGEGASLVSIEDAAGDLTATDVEAALAEIVAAVGPLVPRVDGEFVPTFLGFSSDPGGSPMVKYTILNGVVHIWLQFGNGTSNSTLFRIDSIPAAIRPVNPVNCIIPIVGLLDAGVVDVGIVNIQGAGFKFDYGPAATTWTASGSKGLTHGTAGGVYFSYILDMGVVP